MFERNPHRVLGTNFGSRVDAAPGKTMLAGNCSQRQHPMQPPAELQGMKLGRPRGLSLAGAPPQRPRPSRVPLCSGGSSDGDRRQPRALGKVDSRCSSDALHIKTTSVMCFHFPPEEMSAPLLPSLPSLRQHIFVRLHSHFFLPAVNPPSLSLPSFPSDRHQPAMAPSVMPTGRHGAGTCRDSGL